MFKIKIEDNLGQHPLKSSQTKALRQKVEETYPNLGGHLDDIWPKKAKVVQLKLKGDLNFVALLQIDDEIKFVDVRDCPITPTLKILHKYPYMMPFMQCDKGAIKHILSGSNIMCPGLTSPGGKMDDVKEGQAVAIMAEGKQHAMGIGMTKMSAQDIKRINKDVAIDVIQYLNDGLWQYLRGK